MDVYWLEQAQSDVPVENDWLSAGECDRLNAMRFPKRRADWRLGRWTAKRALSLYLRCSWSILNLWQTSKYARRRPGRQRCLLRTSQRLRVFPSATATALHFVRSRRSAQRWAAIWNSSSPGATPSSPTISPPKSKRWLRKRRAADRPWLVTLLWSAKESALKALHEGLRLDTRSVTVSLIESGDNVGGRRGEMLGAIRLNCFDTAVRSGVRLRFVTPTVQSSTAGGNGQAVHCARWSRLRHR